MRIADMTKANYRFFDEQSRIEKKQKEVVRKLNKDLEFLSKNSGKYILMLNNAKPEIYSSGKTVWAKMNKTCRAPYATQVYFGKISQKSIQDYPVLCSAHQSNIDRLSQPSCIRRSNNICQF